MIFYYILKLPINLLIQFLKFCEKMELKNRGYLRYLFVEFWDRVKRIFKF
jgi:hypothetical protein